MLLNMLFKALAASSLANALVTAPMSMDERSLGKRQTLNGKATFYGGNVEGGTCSFAGYKLPAGLYGTAISDSNWNNAAQCGGCVAASYGGKYVTAMVSVPTSSGKDMPYLTNPYQIVDQCPGCGPNHLDLFQDAFTQLAPASKGVINLNWQYVPCPHIQGPLEIRMKSGVSPYWFSAQVINAQRRTSKLEVSTDQGRTWRRTQRQTYNYFEIASGELIKFHSICDGFV